jgi:hypothetical protein
MTRVSFAGYTRDSPKRRPRMLTSRECFLMNSRRLPMRPNSKTKSEGTLRRYAETLKILERRSAWPGQVSSSFSFIKTFEVDEFYSIYCEREWRSVCPFSFTFDDVAMIVLPHRAEGRTYFSPFVDGRAKTLAVPRAIPIVPWETLLES